MTFRPLRAIKEINEQLDELQTAAQAAEEEARFEIARSATNFSRKSQEVVDSTMSLSALLMRAGEVDEAKRLLAEVERDVRREEAELIETVHEVKAEGAIRRKRMTRLRLAKLLATAMLGASMVLFSAFGIAVASFIVDDDPSAVDQSASHQRSGRHGRARHGGSSMKTIEVAGVEMKLTRSQLVHLETLTSGKVDAEGLEVFLLGILPSDVAERVHAVLTQVGDNADPAKVLALGDSAKKKAAKTADARGPEAQPANEPSSEPSPSNESSPSNQPSQGSGSGNGGSSGGAEPTPEDEDETENAHTPNGLPSVSAPPAEA